MQIDPDGPISIWTHIFLDMKSENIGAHLWFRNFTCLFRLNKSGSEMILFHITDTKSKDLSASWKRRGRLSLVSDHALAVL